MPGGGRGLRVFVVVELRGRGVAVPSGRERDQPQAGERFGKGQSPRPVLGQAQEHLALSAGDPGGDVQ